MSSGSVKGTGGGDFTVEQQLFLRKHVRDLAIAHIRDGRLRKGKGPLEEAEIAKGLAEAEKLGLRGRKCGGVFVTFSSMPGHRNRGCIGQFFPDEEMMFVIQRRTVSALHDDRFQSHPITLEELQATGPIDISISVLSEPKEVPDDIRGDALLSYVKVGVHGIYVHEKNGYRSGTYLPQVGTEMGWTTEEFLYDCAVHKAGIRTKDPINDKNLTWLTYTATVISDSGEA